MLEHRTPGMYHHERTHGHQPCSLTSRTEAAASRALRALRPLPQQAARQVGARVRGHGHKQV
jgi:hypothetical protein